MNLRRDHVAGGAFVLAGALVLAVSCDLPFGTLASPGAGMLPTLLVGFLMALRRWSCSRAPARARRSATIAWTTSRTPCASLPSPRWP